MESFDPSNRDAFDSFKPKDNKSIDFQTKNDCAMQNSVDEDITLLIQQISAMNINKNMIFKTVNQLQENYKELAKKTKEQENQIKFLNSENKKLLEERHSLGNQDNKNVKANELKLSTLQADLAYYQKLNDQEKKMLIEKNSILKFHLQQALLGLERYKGVVRDVEKMYSGLYEKCRHYTYLLREKSKLTNEIVKAALDQIKDSTSQQLTEFDNITDKYEGILSQQEILEYKWKLFEENDLKKLKEVIFQNEKNVEFELKNFTDLVNNNVKTTEVIDEDSLLKLKVSISTLQSQTQDVQKIDPEVTKKVEVPCAHTFLPKQVGEEIQTDLKHYRTNYDNYELECICEPCDD